MAWDTRTTQFACVINIPYGAVLEYYEKNVFCKMLNQLNSLGYYYWAILHDKDTNINGELKTPHYHVVIMSPKRQRCSTLCYRLQYCLDNQLLETIQVTPCDSLALSVQYLTHKNDVGKHQYTYESILTNNKAMLNDLFVLDRKAVKVDEYVLFRLIDEGYEEPELLFKIGLGNFNCYHKVIKLLYEYKKFPHRWNKIAMLYNIDQNNES